MKRTTGIIAFMLLMGFVLWKCSTHRSAIQGALPPDVCPTCVVAADTFKHWFVGDSVKLNGTVTPANSVAFQHKNNCQFYQWSERMFLWATSPTKNGPVLASSEFFNVTPPDSAGNRMLIPHVAGYPIRMTGHIAKFGPNRLPIVVDKKGKFFEVEKPTPGAKTVVKDASGATVEVDHVIVAAHNFSFIDKTGKAIVHPQALIQHKRNASHFVQKFMVGKKAVFLDGAGNVVDSEEGQATGDALRAQNGSLVYYLTLVNDVYAEYLNLAKTFAPAMRKRFPTTATELHAIVVYAKAHNRQLPDSNALAMEIKSSWVEASSLGADSSNYVLMTATIPTYDTTKNTIWLPKSEKTVRMALVGMHIAGSVAGHPEMVWSTFEHKMNTPNAPFSYLNSKKDTVNVPQDGGTGWLFTANAADTAFNVSHITTNDPSVQNGPNTDTLFAQPNFTISASNTLRTMPWGSPSPAKAYSNPQDTTSVASNTEILSINTSITGMLAPGDIRANYLLIGATWTPNGSAPSGNSYSGVDTAGVSIGTSVLANSTMETYFQSPSQSCFTCHSNNPGTPTLSPDTISHVFTNIQIFPPVFTGVAGKGKKK
ncbi:hypothetical protein [uncultured Mucilaginibacter sp.]|uniref:hypothetical protein n=1 Tax=uncultured Mucilaginibacter sp. TaxID=797541 RepID=UPI0025F47777|nr:hypothetical protein [uncultured Mucilaginibacter sp.]